MRRHLSVSSFTLLVWCKPSSSTRLIASFTFDQWCQQLISCASTLTIITVFECSVTSKTDLCITTFPCILVLNQWGRFASFQNLRTLAIFFWPATWPAILATQRHKPKSTNWLMLLNKLPSLHSFIYLWFKTPEDALVFLFFVWDAVLGLKNGGTHGRIQSHWTKMSTKKCQQKQQVQKLVLSDVLAVQCARLAIWKSQGLWSLKVWKVSWT